ncbi:MAG: hypothetical protein WEB53_16250 [Akkermansiaceae bacterium]
MTRPPSPLINANFTGYNPHFRSVGGRQDFYQLEGNDNLPTGAWHKIGAVVAGDGTVVTFTDASGSASGRAFYRARCWVE